MSKFPNKFKKGEKQLAILLEVQARGGMTYTEIIKMAYEMNYGRGTFNKVENRGYWSGIFIKPNNYIWGNKVTGWANIFFNKEGKKYVINGDGMKQIQILMDKFSK